MPSTSPLLHNTSASQAVLTVRVEGYGVSPREMTNCGGQIVGDGAQFFSPGFVLLASICGSILLTALWLSHARPHRSGSIAFKPILRHQDDVIVAVPLGMA